MSGLLPSVSTARLVLRPVRASDAEATAELMTLDVALNLSSWRSPLSLAEAADRIGRSIEAAVAAAALDLAICRRTDGRLMGWVGLALVAPARARLGYWLGTRFQGQGYMSEAAPAALAAGCAFLRAETVEACARPDNLPSVAVLEKLGMRKSGERLERFEWQGTEALCTCYEAHCSAAG